MTSTVDCPEKPRRSAGYVPGSRSRGTLDQQSPFDSAITFWRGTSGHPYVHSIYSLAGCPEMPPASVMFVRRCRTERGRVVLKVMCVEHDAPSLNRAEIRRFGAQLGATEVHLHFANGDRIARHTANFDLATRHGGIEIVGK